jgi:hypothetical protein
MIAHASGGRGSVYARRFLLRAAGSVHAPVLVVEL